MLKYLIIAIISGILSAIAQVLLKISSNKKHNGLKQYMNLYVIFGYGITFLCMILMIFAYKGLPYKIGSILESLIYIYIMILGKLVLDEKITKKKLIGNLIIITGVIVFSLA